MTNIKDLLLRLVAVRSDTGTELECDMAEEIYKVIQEEEYFQKNPQYCGKYYGGDRLNRPVVWALRKGKSTKTLMFMGHYDVVDLECYGPDAPYALKPEELRERFKKRFGGDEVWQDDLENPNWMFGRGAADMKAGLAISLATVFKEVDRDISLLFVAVPDEENMSVGARMALSLYEELQNKFGLSYELCIVGESCTLNTATTDKPYVIMGTTGKVMLTTVVKGGVSHASRVLNGFNPSAVLAGIIEAMEIDEEMISQDQGVSTQPPTVQIFKTLKESYDASLPEFCGACFNVMFLSSVNAESLMNKLFAKCEAAAAKASDKYNTTFDHVKALGTVDEQARIALNPLVITFDRLKQMIVEQKGEQGAAEIEAAARKTAEDKTAGGMSIPEASMYFIKELMSKISLPVPTVVVGIAPPYYPPVHISRVNEAARQYFDGIEGGYVPVEYTPGMTDVSYTSCLDVASETHVMKCLAFPADLYSMDFDKLGKLQMPTVMIGAKGKYIHQIGERVLISDVEEKIPQVFEDIIAAISAKA